MEAIYSAFNINPVTCDHKTDRRGVAFLTVPTMPTTYTCYFYGPLLFLGGAGEVTIFFFLLHYISNQYVVLLSNFLQIS